MILLTSVAGIRTGDWQCHSHSHEEVKKKVSLWRGTWLYEIYLRLAPGKTLGLHNSTVYTQIIRRKTKLEATEKFRNE